MTQGQIKMIINIAESDYTVVNGSIPEKLKDVGEVWMSEAVRSKEDKGTFVSLENAGMIKHYGADDPRDRTVALTEAGFAAYQKAKAEQTKES